MSRVAIAAGAAALLALAACGSANQQQTGISHAAGALKSAVMARGGGAGSPRGLDQLSRAAIAGQTAPMMLALIEANQGGSTLSIGGRNGPYTGWLSPDGVGVTLRGGVLVSTKGLGFDLMAADAAPVIAALASGGDSSRTYRHIVGDLDIRVSRFECSVSQGQPETIEVLEILHTTRRLVESCTGPDGTSIRNEYWIGSDGTMWKSRQWISPALGYVSLQTLIK